MQRLQRSVESGPWNEEDVAHRHSDGASVERVAAVAGQQDGIYSQCGGGPEDASDMGGVDHAVDASDRSVVLGSSLCRLLADGINCLIILILFSLDSNIPLTVRECRPRQFHSYGRLYHSEDLPPCDDCHTLRELYRMQIATIYHCMIGPHADAYHLSDLLGAVEHLPSSPPLVYLD